MSQTESGYTKSELLAVTTARLIEDRKTIFVGIGMPMIAASLAQQTHAPNIGVIFEGGIVSPQLKSGALPLSTQEIRCARKALALVDTLDIFLYQQRGFVDYGFLGAAQVDQYGNINTSVIGDFHRPKVRFPGSGGANDIASTNTRVIISVPHEKRRFVEKTDFITTPGYIRGGDTRIKSGLFFGGPYKVVTDLGIFGFDKESKRMRLEQLQIGVTVEEVKQNTGFELLISPDVRTIDPPTKSELSILRAIDPEGMMLAN